MIMELKLYQSIIFSVALLFTSTVASGQDPIVIDSLLAELRKDYVTDSIRGELYQELGSKYIYTSTDTFMLYSRLSLKEFKKTNYKTGQLRATINIGNCYTTNNKLDSAIYYLDMAKNQVDDDDFESQVFLYFNYAYLHHNNTSQYDDAISNYLIAIDYAEKLKDTTKLAVFHYNIADIFGQNDMNEKAFPHNKKALNYAESSNLQALKPIVRCGIGVYYLESENFDSSMLYFNQALNETDLVNDYNGAFYAYNGISETYFGMEQFEQSYQYGLKAHDYAEKMQVEYELALSNCKLSATALMSNRLKEGEKYWLNFLSINGSIDNVFLAEGCYRLQAESLASQNKPTKALRLMEQYIELKDSVFSKENRSIIAELETKYETEKKQSEIENQKLNIKAQKSQRNLILTGSFLLSLLGLGTIGFLIQRSRKNKLIYRQENLLKEKHIEQLRKEKKILGMNAMIEGQEAERVRIAKDLHDGLGGLLSTVKAHFSNIQGEIQKIEKIDVYNKANELVDEACDEVRRISHNLMPGALRLEGLKSAVEHLGEDMEAAHPFAVKVEAIGFETRMEEGKEVFVFRIIQEALNNIIKHANAKEVLIQLSETEDEYHFIVEDDGKGFDPLQIQSGLGLKSIQSRVDFLKGNLDVDTRVGVGTTLSWHIPKC